MGKQSLLRVVSVHVPGRTGCGVKVVVPMLVKCVIGVGYGVNQTIVQHLGGSCRACQAISTSSTCLNLLLCKANMVQATKHTFALLWGINEHSFGACCQGSSTKCAKLATEQIALSDADAFCSICAHEVMHGCVRSSNAMKQQL